MKNTMAVVVAVLGAVGCGAVENADTPDAASGNPDAAETADARDEIIDAAAPPDAPPAGCTPSGEWGEPSVVLNINTTSASEVAPSVTGDYLEIYFRRASGTNDPEGRIMVAHRGADSLPWGTPELVPGTDGVYFYEPKVSADGLELYVNNGSTILRASRSERSEPFGSFSPLWSGRSVSLSSDGLAMYYRVSVDTLLRARHRAQLGADWGTEETVNLSVRYNSVSVSPDEMYAVLTLPTNGFQDPHAVATERPSTDAPWPAPVEIPSLVAAQARDCDLVSDAEMLCTVLIDNNADVYRFTRPCD
jgi:hypothetical protein